MIATNPGNDPNVIAKKIETELTSMKYKAFGKLMFCRTIESDLLSKLVNEKETNVLKQLMKKSARN